MTLRFFPWQFRSSGGHNPVDLALDSASFPELASLDLSLPSQVEGDPSAPRVCGHFQILRFLGQGGMGRVFEAFDPHLQRIVALKLLSAGGPGEVERLLGEARAQARIDHPHVVKVFECGLQDGQPYLAMQMVKGTTLGALARTLKPRGTIQLIIQACYGVHAAHEHGLLHRDLKSSNLLVEPRNGGGWTTYVADFGLARPPMGLEIQPLSHVIGTPGFMSPEQIQHQALDRRSDIYALGVCLFEALTARLPFESDDLQELLRAVVTEPAPSLLSLRPELPEDLDWICKRCLAKAPGNRYPSAEALAEDLKRFLEGLPVDAHPPSKTYRIRRWIGRRRALAALSLVSTLLLAGSGAWGVSALRRARQRSDYTTRFVRAAEELEVTYLRAMTLPTHDMGPDSDSVRRRLEELRQELPRVGTAGAAPLHFALGRGYLLLQEHSEARRNLEQAWKEGFQTPEAAMALGLVLTELYQESLASLRGPAREVRRAQLEPLLRQPALAYLRQTKGSYFASASQALGTLALLEGRSEEALIQARNIQAASPGDLGGLLLELRVYRERVQESILKAHFDEAEAALEDWQRASERALTLVRTAPALHLEELRRMVALLGYRILRGTAKPSDLETALEAGRLALSNDSRSSKIHAELATIHRIWADGLQDSGQDPQKAQVSSLSELEKAVVLAPQEGPLWARLGDVCNQLANLAIYKDVDPSPFLNRGRESLDLALKLLPGDPDPLRWLGTNLTLQARVRMDKGEDPGNALPEAEAVLRRSLPNPGAYLTLGVLFRDYGAFQLRQGKPWEESFQKALEAADAGLALSPRNPKFLQNKLLLLVHWAEGRVIESAHPDAQLTEARKVVAEARSVNPVSLIPLESTVDLEILDHLHRTREGEPIEGIAPRVAEALKELDGTLNVENKRLKWAIARTEASARKGLTSLGTLQDGLRAAEAFLQKNPNSPRAWMRKRALLYWAARPEPDPKKRADLESQANAALSKAMALNPGEASYEARIWGLK